MFPRNMRITEKFVTPKEALQIIETLAKGIDPETGEQLPPDSCLNNPHTIRALFLASKALGAPTSQKPFTKENSGMAGKPWTDTEDQQLLKAFDAGSTVKGLAARHERSTGGITSRLVRLGRVKERSEALERGT